MKQWWVVNWPFVVAMLLLSVVFFVEYKIYEQQQKDYNERFNVCMSDIHNAYVCETYARAEK